MGGDEGGEEEEVVRKVKGKHDSGQCDLAKVTDYAEEKEVAVSTANVDNLIQPQLKTRPEKIVIRKDDIELLVRELEVSKAVADRKLREHRGDVKATIRDILAI